MTYQPEHPTGGPLPPPRRRRRAHTGELPLDLLEPGQFDADTAQPVARARLSRRARTGLWLLRIFAVVVSAMVVYTFVSQLHG
jgi:hypothetical protein